MRRQRADAYLHEPPAQLFFHDSGKRAGVRIAIAFELIVKISVRVDVQDRDGPVILRDRAHDWVRDRMIAAQGDRAVATVENGVDGGLNFAARDRRVVAQPQVARILER